jgi:hypothetical protein
LVKKRMAICWISWSTVFIWWNWKDMLASSLLSFCSFPLSCYNLLMIFWSLSAIFSSNMSSLWLMFSLRILAESTRAFLVSFKFDYFLSMMVLTVNISFFIFLDILIDAHDWLIYFQEFCPCFLDVFCLLEDWSLIWFEMTPVIFNMIWFPVSVL